MVELSLVVGSRLQCIVWSSMQWSNLVRGCIVLGWEGGTSALAAVIVSAGVFPAPHFETDFGAGVCVDVDGVSMSVPIYPLILVVWVKTLLKSKGVDMNCSRLVFLMCVWRWSCSPCILP